MLDPVQREAVDNAAARRDLDPGRAARHSSGGFTFVVFPDGGPLWAVNEATGETIAYVPFERIDPLRDATANG